MVKTRKHRSSTRKIKKGGGRNWRPNRSKSKPMYLNSQIKIVKDLKKYYKSDVLDLSTYQKRIIEGTDEEKEEARADLKDIRFYLRNLKDNLRSYTFNVGLLVSSGLGIILNISHANTYSSAAKDAINQIKVKLSINDLIQTIDKLLKDTNVETTTLNPLVYKKVNSKAINANVVERDGKLVVIPENDKKNRNEFEPTSTN